MNLPFTPYTDEDRQNDNILGLLFLLGPVIGGIIGLIGSGFKGSGLFVGALVGLFVLPCLYMVFLAGKCFGLFR